MQFSWKKKKTCKRYEKWWRLTFQEDNNPKHTTRAETDSVDQMFSISKSKSRPKPNCEFVPGYKQNIAYKDVIYPG